MEKGCEAASDENRKNRKAGTERPIPLRPSSRRHRLPRLPKNYVWTIDERVVLVAFTGAGLVPTSTFGSFQGLTKCHGRKAAIVSWDRKDALVSSTVAIQRIRPISFIPE